MKTEIFPRDLGRKIGEAQSIRHKSDYDEFYIASKEKTRELVDTAKEVLQRITEYINQQGSEQAEELLD